jgi:glycosyltransferase involved in cell wall biosynthesis
MKISIVIPTYQRPFLLLRCIRSLLDQYFRSTDYEIIVVSDGPDEQTRIALKEMDPRHVQLKYFSLSYKRGPAAARNFGWKKANGRLVAFTDDDCIPDLKWLWGLWSAFLKSSSAELVAFAGKTTVPLPPVPTDYERNIAHLETADFITANCACTKEALEQTGGFDENFTMAWREDSDLQFKLMIRNIPIIKTDEARVVHPVRTAVWGISIREERKGIFNALLYKKFPVLYKRKIQPAPPWLYYFIIGFLFLFLACLITRSLNLALFAMAGWLLTTIWFTAKRLKNTSHSVSHVMEMAVTSAVIPVLSIYWRFYGSWKFRTLLLP